MKSILRVFVFTVISLKITQYIIGAFNFGNNDVKTFILIAFALGLLYFFFKPLLKIISLPSGGIGYLLLIFIVTFIVLYILTLFIPSFTVKSVTISNLIIFGFVLPSKSLTSLWATVCSAFVASFLYTFFDWLCSKR
jgi:uncharacterized membrane protein YvlD (DUF360 family)